MSGDRQSVPVSLPPGLVDRLDGLVGEGVFESRSEALRYGARLVVREAYLKRLHERADSEARADVEERLDQKRVSRPQVILAELKADDRLASDVNIESVAGCG